MIKIALVRIVAALALTAASGACPANDSPAQNGPTRLDGPPVWPQARFSASEIQGWHLDDLEVEPVFCGCYDKPNKHFPYALVLLKTSKGDLIVRPERVEGAVTYMPLAVRRGNQYCELESDNRCYGSFSDPCEFTDFRYGENLALFFPTCKSE